MNDDVYAPLTLPPSDSPYEKKPRRFSAFSLLLPVVVFALVVTASWSHSSSSTNSPVKVKRHTVPEWIVNTTIMFPKELINFAREGQKVIHRRINPSRVNMQQVTFDSRTICSNLRAAVNAIVNASKSEFVLIIQPENLDRCIGIWKYSERIYMATPQQSPKSSSAQVQFLFHRITGADYLRGTWTNFVERMATRLNVPQKNDEKELLERLSAVRMRTMDSSEEEQEEKLNYIDLLSDGDDSVNECENAYARVCGKFSENNEHLRNRIHQFANDYDDHLKQLLTSSPATKSNSINKVIGFYRDCVDTISNSTKAAIQFWRYVKGDLIDWPLLEHFVRVKVSHGYEKYDLRDPEILNETCLSNLDKCPLQVMAFKMTLNETVIRFAKDLGKKVDLKRLEEDIDCTLAYHVHIYKIENDFRSQVPNCVGSRENEFAHNNAWIGRFEEARAFLGTDYVAYRVDGNQITKQKPFPPQEVCLFAAQKGMPAATYGLYVRNALDFKSIDAITEIFTNIRKAFVEQVDKAYWFDSNVKSGVSAVISSTTLWPGHDYTTLNDTLLDSYYMDILEGENFSNFFLEFSRLRHFTNYSKSPLPDLENGFHFDVKHRSIVMPAGAAKLPFFSPSERRSFNYGSIGFTMAHELAHSIDPANRLLWITSPLPEKQECLENQFSNITIPEIGEALPGDFMISEIFSDVAGLPIAYKAFVSSSENGISPKEKKEFFHAAARLFCSAKPTPDELRVLIKTDEHPPAHFRMNELFKNVPEFSEAFNCQKDSKMNPQKKCSFWQSDEDTDVPENGY